ncbi:MlaD family protein [uncultured Fluviicola sp.]|uniref:MlaD family protein n=1 Tax=uncultured Fluviicola sp. TaxID=463303 RepID=UPI0025E24F54|nr:MlaD family protein [uncultured Fluviicola sp.]
MKKETNRNIRLGLIVLIGTLGIIAALYYVGSKQRLFGDTIHIRAEFYNVNGLRSGNSVRYAGIDVGTVDEVEIVSDSSVMVIMSIDRDACRFIRKDAVAVIGTDGLMGNRIVNINASHSTAPEIKEGDKLLTYRSVEMDATLQTLNKTNQNLNVISADLRVISGKLNSDGSLLNLLLDPAVSADVQSAITHFRYVGENTAVLTGDLRAVARNLREGKGTAGLILGDTVLRNNVSRTVVNIRSLTDSLAIVSGNLQSLSDNLKNGQGIVRVLFTDPEYLKKFDSILMHFENGADDFDESMNNLKHRWPFKEKKKGKR